MRLADALAATLEMILAKARAGIRFNKHMEGDGETVSRHAYKLGLEGCVLSTSAKIRGWHHAHYPAKSWWRRMKKSPGRVPGL